MNKKLKFQSTLTCFCQGDKKIYHSNGLYINYNDASKRNIVEHEIKNIDYCKQKPCKNTKIPCELLWILMIK